MTDDAPQPPVNYPLASGALRPAWHDGRSRLLAAMAVGAGLLAIALRTPLVLSCVDDVALRVLMPCGLGVVLAFAPRPSTSVGQIARDLTVIALCISMFAGNLAPVMLAAYPLLLMTSVLMAHAGEALLRRRGQR